MALPSGVEHIIKKSINGLNTYIFPYSKTHLIWDNARQVYLNQILNDIYNSKQDLLTAGTGISIETNPVTGDVIISNTQTSAEWGNIEGNIEDQTDLDNILAGLDNDITAVEGDVDDIQELIPVQATPQNQLADKDFVNSSIATSTATFRETYNVVIDLHLSTSATHQQVATALGNTISVADNNDYCFVEIPTDASTPTETLQVDRYKYNGSSWSFEYALNNSGYTAAQWKAINSGITSGKVSTYEGYATSKQDTLIAGTNITIGADGKTISSDIPNATQQVYGKVLLGASGGAATYESVENRLPICYHTTASEVKTTSMIVKSSVSDNGKILTENGFVYNTSGNPTVNDTKVVCDLGVGLFEKKLENLTMNTEYHIKSYGQNASGLVYGSELVQSTLLNPIPPEYQLVECLSGNGNQYIAIGYTEMDVFEIDCMCTNGVIFGSSIGTTAFIMSGSLVNNANFTFGPTTWLDNEIHVRHTYKMTNNNQFLRDGIYYASIPYINYNNILDLFRYTRTSGTTYYTATGSIFHLKTYEGSNNILNLYPVYRIADNKPGMYDIVNGVFYTNQGTGEFTVGPDKEWDE